MPLPVGLSFTAGALAPAELEWQRVIQGRQALQAQQDAQRAWQEQLRSLTSPDASVLPQQFTPAAPQGQMAQPQGQPPAPPMSGSSQQPGAQPIGQDTYWSGAPDSPHFTLPQQSATVSPAGGRLENAAASAGPTSPGVPAASRQAPGGLPPSTPPAGGQAPQQNEPFDPLQRVKQWAKEIRKAAPNAPPQVQAMMLQQRIQMAKTAFPEEKLLMQSQLQIDRLQAQQQMMRDRLDEMRDASIRRAQTQERGQNIQLYLGGERNQIARERISAAEKARQDMQTRGQLSDETVQVVWGELSSGNPQSLQHIGFGNVGAKNLDRILSYGANQLKREGMSPDQVGREITAMRADYGGIMQAERTAATTVTRTGLAIEELSEFLPEIDAASKRVSRTEYPTINKLIIAANTGTGSPDAIKLGQWILEAKAAYEQALSRGGVPTDRVRERSDAILNPAWTIDQLGAASQNLMKAVQKTRAAAQRVQRGLTRGIRGEGPESPPGGAGGSSVDTGGWELVK